MPPIYNPALRALATPPRNTGIYGGQPPPVPSRSMAPGAQGGFVPGGIRQPNGAVLQNRPNPGAPGGYSTGAPPPPRLPGVFGSPGGGATPPWAPPPQGQPSTAPTPPGQPSPAIDSLVNFRATPAGQPTAPQVPPPIDPQEQWRMEQDARAAEFSRQQQADNQRIAAERAAQEAQRQQERQWEIENQKAEQEATARQAQEAAAEAERQRQFQGGQTTQTQTWQSGQGAAERAAAAEAEARRLAATQAEGGANRTFEGEQGGLSRAHEALLAQQEREHMTASEQARIAAEQQAQQREQQFTQSRDQAGWGREDTTHNISRQEGLADEERMFGRLPGLFDLADGGGGGIPPGGGNSAGDMAFARAKDREGIMGSRALSDLKGTMTQTGNAGGGLERGALGALYGGTMGNLNDVSLGQAEWEANRAANVEDRNYAGNLTKRGQNLGMIPSILGLAGNKGRAY